MINLKMPNQFSDETKEKNIWENFRDVENAFNAISSNLLFSKSDSTNRSTTSTTYVNNLAFDVGLNISGGLTLLIGHFNLRNDTAGQSTTIGLFIDGAVAVEASVGSGAGIVQASVPLFYIANILSGVHRLEIRWKVTGGTGNFNQSVGSYFYGVELLNS